MSGRPAPNRGKKGHRRGFDPADSHSHHQSSSSSNHSGRYGTREQAPRFLSRQRNGDGRSNSGGDPREYYDDYPSGGRKEGGGGHKGTGGSVQGNTGSFSGRTSNLGKAVMTHFAQDVDVH